MQGSLYNVAQVKERELTYLKVTIVHASVFQNDCSDSYSYFGVDADLVSVDSLKVGTFFPRAIILQSHLTYV